MCAKVVNSEEKWNGKWPRYDPHRGYLLCEPCWNHKHWVPAYFDKNGKRWPRTNNCDKGECACGCIHDLAPRKPKFTGEGQPDISMENPLEIGPKS